MKIDTRIVKTHGGKYMWEDDADYPGQGFLMYSVGTEVPDKWLEQQGLLAPESVEPEPEPAPEPKKPKTTTIGANKAVKGPANDK